jgi:hypothetical protein
VIAKNVGGVDRWIRAVVGVVLAAAGVASGLDYLPFGTLGGTVMAAGSAGLLCNVVTQRCIANRLLGLNTCERPTAETDAGTGAGK